MKFKNVLVAIVFLTAMFAMQTVSAQNNYANTKVDQLTDEQIKGYMIKAEALGYKTAQLEQLAADQGLKAEEIQKLKLRIEKITKAGALEPNKQPTTTTNTKRTYQNEEDSLKRTVKEPKVKEPPRDAFGNLIPQVYGAELFVNDNISFQPNLNMPTPKGYVIGAGDVINVELTGNNERSFSLPVSPEGKIRMDRVGLISVGSLSIEQATAKLRSTMSAVYPALRTGASAISVTLGNIRSINVTITGAVTTQGTFTLPSLATVYHALYASGGPSANGSFRKIQLIRNEKVISTIDAYDYLINGIKRGDIQLRDQDVIKVPVYDTRVEISGEVKTAAIFEVLPGETLQDVLRYASGFKTEAYKTNIKVFQNTDRERRIVDIPASAFGTYRPKDGDKIIVEKISERFENRVEIQGAVFRPGFFELESGLTLRKLIAKAEGLKEDAFMNHGYISRLNPDNTLSVLPFDVARVLAGTQTDLLLQREDKVIITSILDMREEYKVSIQGEVRSPNSFPYADNMNLETLIQMAGGFKEGATPDRISVARRIKNSNTSSEAAVTAEVFVIGVDRDLKLIGEPFVLKPFDIVTIRNAEGYEYQKQVFIEGEVRFPGPYTITKKNERISDLIKDAGGFTALAYIDGASLRRPGPKMIDKKAVDKNAIDKSDDDEKTIKNLKRLQENGAKDTTSVEILKETATSDLVGINMKKIMENQGSKSDLTLEDGDIIRVPRQPQTVRVSGEVLNPNNIVFLPGKSFKQYVNSAGGFTFNAYKKGVYIKHANGSVEAAKKFLFFNNYPIVKPGSEIFVPKRAEREKIGTQEIIGISTGIASLAAIILTLIK